MNIRFALLTLFRQVTAVFCIAALACGNAAWAAPPQESAAAPSDNQAAAKLPAEQLDSLVAPIALYPDPMLSQVLIASTYPLEVIQLKQWLDQHKGLSEKALADAVKKEDWDPTHPRAGRLARCGEAVGGQHQVDHRSW